MKNIFKGIVSNLLALLVLTTVIPDGFKISGNYLDFLKIALIMYLLQPLIQKIIKIIMLPLSFLSLGIINLIFGLLVFYLSTIIFDQIVVSGQNYNAFNIYALAFPMITLSKFWVYVVASLIYSLTIKFLNWIYE